MRAVQTEHLLRVMIGVLILLATIHLGIGEHSATLTLCSLAMLAVSAYVTDTAGLFSLRQPMANCAALGVVLVAAVNAYQIDRHSQLLAVADLQSYLQYVLLFQPKTPRVYWQLAALSLGQVAIASTLVPGPLFGFMLLLYVLAGIITFALLLLNSESTRFQVPASRMSGLATFAAGGASSRAPVLFGNSAASDVRVIGWGLLRQGTLICVTTGAVAAILFLLLPRWDIEKRDVASSEPLRSVGFSKAVILGELGEVIRNSDVVMRVEFFHGLERRPFKLAGEPLFRGTVVTHYQDGAWSQPQTNSPMQVPTETKSSFVRQHITAEALDVAELCCIFPVFAIGSDSRLRINARRDHLIRQEDYRAVKLDFELGTTGIVNDTQRNVLPCETRLGGRETSGLLQMPTSSRGSQSDPFPGLRATAAAVLLDRNIDPQNRKDAAMALNDYLSRSGRYFYSLEPQQRDAAVDPLEDFVTTHRLGHCEYFSGALVMMLRSQGIPARMAIGFKGGGWNSLGMYYQVQQLHAHTWVEVHLDQHDVPDDALGEPSTPAGAWLVLDPTEGTQERNLAAQDAGILARLHQYVDYARVLWTNYVVGFNSRRQHQAVYEPLVEGTRAALESVASPQAWRARWHAVANSHLGVFWEWYRRHWFSWRGGLVAAGFSLVIFTLFWAARGLVGALRRLGLVGAGRFFDDPPVLEMYRRLEAALAKRGLRRHPGQTAHEFAVAAGGDLAESIEHRRLAPLPRRIVEVFYRVRFGGHTLDNLEANAVEHALVELEQALGRSH
jgi:hypothetical protein